MSVGPEGDTLSKKEVYRLRNSRRRAHHAWVEARELLDFTYCRENERAEEIAHERYMDICGDLMECTEHECHAHTPDHILCAKHREGLGYDYE